MRSKGSRFTLGVWGYSRTLRFWRQPFATVRSRSQPFAWGPYGRAYGKFRKRGHFWRFLALRSFISRGRQGTSWHSNMFQDVSKVVLCGRRNTFATFSEDALHFSCQPQHFGHLGCHFVWQAQHFRRVELRVFCKSKCQLCAKWWQGANSVAGVAFCDMSWKSTEASNETSNLRSVRTKTRRKTSILKLQSVKFEEISHEMLVLMLQHVSSRVAGLLVPSQCLWGKLQNPSLF